jgi:hypothetical protein
MQTNQQGDNKMSKAVENVKVKEQYADVYAYTQQVLDLIAKDEINKEEAAWVTRQTVDNFRDHVNPGFLGYRKSVTKDGQFAAVEWKDATSSTVNRCTARTCLILCVRCWLKFWLT